ncbi:hypothetical protein ABIE41_003864 [Bosea sp. OAE506]|uniref:hypothetical protein n=1 Tax=Bosea sp. OAE506 TaxID=2663870 RepID=UPI00178C0885
MSLVVRTDIEMRGVERLIAAAGPRAAGPIARALNRTGTPTANRGKREIRKVLGLRNHPYAKRPLGDALKRRTSIRKANAATLTFSMAGFGQGLPALYYRPKEAPAGASINWLGGRRMIARSFYLGGKFPRRRRSKISHVVWQRTGKGKWALGRVRGPGVPEAMQTLPFGSAWEGEAARRLPAQMKTALEALFAGYHRSR